YPFLYVLYLTCSTQSMHVIYEALPLIKVTRLLFLHFIRPLLNEICSKRDFSLFYILLQLSHCLFYIIFNFNGIMIELLIFFVFIKVFDVVSEVRMNNNVNIIINILNRFFCYFRRGTNVTIKKGLVWHKIINHIKPLLHIKIKKYRINRW